MERSSSQRSSASAPAARGSDCERNVRPASTVPTAARLSRPAQRARLVAPRMGSGPFLRLADVGHVLAQRRGQVDLVLLLVDQDLADVLGQGVLAQGLALPDALAVVADGLVLRLQVEAEHV